MDVSTPTTNNSNQEPHAGGGLAKDMISEPTSAGSIHGVSQTSGIAEARPPRAPAHSAPALDPFATANGGYQAKTVGNGISIDAGYDDSHVVSNTVKGHHATAGAPSHAGEAVGVVTHKSYSSSASKAAAAAAAAAQAAVGGHAPVGGGSELPTMGQMADAVQATARMASRNGGVRSNSITSDVGAGSWDMGDDDGGDGTGDADLCQPGSEHTGRWTRKEHELFLDALKKYVKVRFRVLSLFLPCFLSLFIHCCHGPDTSTTNLDSSLYYSTLPHHTTTGMEKSCERCEDSHCRPDTHTRTEVLPEGTQVWLRLRLL